MKKSAEVSETSENRAKIRAGPVQHARIALVRLAEHLPVLLTVRPRFFDLEWSPGLGETGPLSQGAQARRKALRIRHITGTAARKKRPRGFKKKPRGLK